MTNGLDLFILDSHNDILSLLLKKDYRFEDDLKGKTHSDLKRFKKGGVNVQVFAIWCDELEKRPFSKALQQMDSLAPIIDRNNDSIALALTKEEIENAIKIDQLAVFFGIEGGHLIENKIENIEHFFNKGARYMTLTWNNSNEIASSSFDEVHSKNKVSIGLSSFGRKAIKKMNELGMMVDVSHLGEKAFWDLVSISNQPIIASHSCAYALCQSHRNLKDDQIKAIAQSGGVIQVNFYSEFLDPVFHSKKEAFLNKHKSEYKSFLLQGLVDYMVEEALFNKYPKEAHELRAPFQYVIDHIEHIIQLVGIDHVGIGGDFDGMSSPALELDDVSCYPKIVDALSQKGYNKVDVQKICGGNFLRVLKECEVN